MDGTFLDDIDDDTPARPQDSAQDTAPGRYLVDQIDRHYRRLTREEEKALFVRYRANGDLDARNQIIVAHSKFAMTQIKGLSHFGLPVENLKGEAIEGLFKALKNFDLEKDTRFTTYSAKYIRSHVQSAILEYHGLPKSDYYGRIFFTLAAEKNKIWCNEPDISTPALFKKLAERYAVRLKYPVTSTIVESIDSFLASIPLSANHKIYMDDNEPELVDTQASEGDTPEEALEKKQSFSLNRAFLYHAMTDITVLQRRLIETLYLSEESRSVPEAAAIIGMSPSVAKNVHSELIRKFQAVARNIDFKTFNHADFDSPTPLPDVHLPTDAHIAANHTAQNFLNSEDYFIFSSLHLCDPAQKINGLDLAEALNMPMKKFNIRASLITADIIKKMPKQYASSAFMRGLDKTISALNTPEPLDRAQAVKAAKDVLDMALDHINETGKIPRKTTPGPHGQSRFWAAATKQLQRDFNTDLNGLIQAWATDQVVAYHTRHGHPPGYSDDLIPGQKKMTWAMLDDVLCDMNDAPPPPPGNRVPSPT